MVEGAGGLGVQKGMFAAFMFNLEVAFLDVDVGGAVDAHGAELDDVALEIVLLDGVHQVGGGDEVVGDGEHGLPVAPHGVGRGGLLGVMHHGFGGEVPENRAEEGVVADVAGVHIDAAAADGLPQCGPLMQVGDREEGLAVELGAGPAPKIIVHHGHLEALPGQAHGRGPTQITVTA